MDDSEYCDYEAYTELCYTRTHWKCPLKRNHEGEHNLVYEREEAVPNE